MKILFSDYDGTLYIDGKVSAENVETIREWRAKGNLFAMASGRQHDNLHEVLTNAGVEYDYLLCFNGSEIFDREGRCLYRSSIPAKHLPALYQLISNEVGWANVCLLDRIPFFLYSL